MAQLDPIQEGRQRIREQGRLPEWTAVERPFFCRQCGRRVLETSVPRGWYILTRSPGNGGRAHRLGLFCSANCLANGTPRFVGIEVDLGESWDTVPSPYRD